MKARNTRLPRPVAASLLAGLVCCVPTGNQPAEIFIGASGVSPSFPRKVSMVSELVADSAVPVANAARCLLRAARKMRRMRRRSRQDLQTGSLQKALTQPSSVEETGWVLARIPECGDHHALHFRISLRYRITSFRPAIKVKGF